MDICLLQIMDIIECERVQLKFELEEDLESPENCFIEQALSELVLREQQLFGKVGFFGPTWNASKYQNPNK